MNRLLAALAALGASSLARGDTPLIPIEALFGIQHVRQAQLSPDGKKVAFLAPNGGTFSLALLDLETHKVTVPVHTEGDSIQEFFWKGSDRIVFAGDIAGIEVPQVAVTDLEGKRVFSLLKPQQIKLVGSYYSGGIVSQRRDDPDHIYGEGYTLDSDYTHQERTAMEQEEPIVFEIDLHNGHRRYLCPASDEDPNASLGDFTVDRAGQIRTAVRTKSDFAELLYREDTNAKWRVIRRYKAASPSWEVRGYTADNRGIYIYDYESAPSGALRIFDPESDSMGPAIFTPEGGEIGQVYPPQSGLIFAPDDGRLIGIRYTTEKPHTYWLEKRMADLQAKLDRSFPNLSVFIGNSDDKATRFLIRTYSDRDLGSYFILDTAKGSLGLVTAVAPQLNPAAMAPMVPISFPARDGLNIPGYITLPLGAAPGKPLPFIIHPHGGPFGPRDVWGFDPEVQFLANRGYGVLQINFRGSGGYGKKFLEAGYHEWGGKMQDDLTDGVKWAIEKGYADPKRVAIFGASYGGYATLAGLVYTPELYKCGINYVGVSDLVEMTRRKFPYESPAALSYYKQAINDDPKALYQRSPVNFVDRIRVPLLNAYGENDGRVNIAKWDELKGKLDKYHKTYSFMLAKDEGHGFTRPEDAIAFYTKVEAFLKENL